MAAVSRVYTVGLRFRQMEMEMEERSRAPNALIVAVETTVDPLPPSYGTISGEPPNYDAAIKLPTVGT